MTKRASLSYVRWKLPAVALLATSVTMMAAPASTPDSWRDDLTPLSAADWSSERAKHLLERAGFGATPNEIVRLAALSPQDAVRSLVKFDGIPNAIPAFDESGIWDPGMDPFP